MTKEHFIELMSYYLKLIRTEFSINQEEMADLLGFSKKTLVEIEKGRNTIGWKGAVTLATIFSNSSILTNVLGGDSQDMVVAIAFQDKDIQYPKTMGGKVWWKPISSNKGFVIQQNSISKHYRLLDSQNCRRFASYNLEKVEEMLHYLDQ